ncbi:MAG: adenylate/guanylate cyclase domain-containing protein [Solirubrobacterales bacterium]
MARDDSEHTFLFADLCGFTALTEVHGDEEAADLAAEFFADARALLGEHGAEEVKTIGDAMMVRCDKPARAIALGLRLVQEVGARHGFPSVRVGLHTGSAVGRDGDWFGGAVNLAARVSGAAAQGEVLLTGTSAAAAGAPGGGALGAIHPHENVALDPRGRRELRNVGEPVELLEASCERSRSAEDLPVDPVCRMAVDPAHAAGTLVHGGVEYCFCSLDCARQFAEVPERYASALADGATQK